MIAMTTSSSMSVNPREVSGRTWAWHGTLLLSRLRLLPPSRSVESLFRRIIVASTVYLIQMLLPVRDESGNAFPRAYYDTLARDLTERFGGVTAHTRAPAAGLWEEPSGEKVRDDVVIYEVMADTLDERWWSETRKRLEAQFEQQELVIRAHEIKRLSTIRQSLHAAHSSPPSPPCEPDCRRRSRRAARVGRQGTARELSRRQRHARLRSRSSWAERSSSASKTTATAWTPRMRGWRSSGTRRARSRRADDLGAIRTLGFRGEALPSIASVSHFTLRTRARGEATGTEVRVNGGAVASVREVGMPEGTSIEVADLFYNLPARRKFLKSDTAESTQISRLVTQMALGYPTVGFSLTSGARKLLECPPARVSASASSSCLVSGLTSSRSARKRPA